MMPRFVPATSADHEILVLMMQQFYACEALRFTANVERAMEELLRRPECGRVYVVYEDHDVAGYFVLTFGYSLEREGRVGLLDELFIMAASRGRGLGKAAVAEAAVVAKAAGCRSLHLEVDHANVAARELYRRAGFATLPRDYLVLALADPPAP